MTGVNGFERALPTLIAQKKQQLAVASAKLQPRNLTQSLGRHVQDITRLVERSHRMIERIIADRGQKLLHISQLLNSLNYKQVLERGFALVRNAQGSLVKQISDTQSGETLSVTLRDGMLTAQVK